MHALKHQVPTIQFTLTVNVNADRTLLLIVGLLWLAVEQAGQLRRGVVVLVADMWDWAFVGWVEDWALIVEAVRELVGPGYAVGWG